MRSRMPVLAAISVGAAVFLGSVSAAPAEDATALGYPVQGASMGALSADAVRGTRFAATTDATIGTVRAYLAGNGTPQTVSASVYLAFPFGDGPNRLVGRSEPQTVSLVAGRWVDFTLTTGAHLQAGRSYYILVHSGGQDGGLSIAYETGRTERSVFAPLSFPTMPDPFGANGAIEASTRTYSVYAVADASLPESLAPPAVSGPATAGPGAHVLSASNGSWRSDTALTYAYQWQACHPDTITNFADSWCNDIAGATGQTLTVTPVPLTTRFRAVVTARNDRGKVAAGSDVFSLLSPTTNVVRPVVSGDARPGSTLSSSFGEWIGLGYQPPGAGPYPRLRLQWQRCLADTCTDVAGATATETAVPWPPAPSSYVVTSADLGRSLRTVVVGDRDAVGQEVVTAVSDPTGIVSSGGGGGGGGEGGSGSSATPDLALALSASRQTASAGDTIQYRVEVRVKNFASTAGATRAVVTDVLPSSVELVSTAVNRGPGCTGTSTLTCDLGPIAGQIVGVVEIVVRLTTSGTLVNTASVKAPEPDPDVSNNTASITISAPQVLTPPTRAAAVVRTVFGSPVALPAGPLAGKPFVLTVAVRRSDTGAPLTGGRLVWSPSAAGKPIKHAESFKAGKARLSLLVPRSARGTLLKIKLGITVSGKSATRLYTYKIR